MYDRDTIRELEHRIHYLREANESLKEEYIRNEKKTMGFVESFHEKINTHNGTVVRLRREMKRLGGKDINVKLERVKAGYEQKLRDAKQKYTELEDNLKVEVQQIEDELDLLKVFVHHRHKCDEELSLLHEKSSKLDERHKEAIEELKSRFGGEEENMKERFRQQKRHIEESSKKTARSALDRNTNAILCANKQLKEEVRLQEGALEKVAGAIRQLRIEYAKLRGKYHEGQSDENALLKDSQSLKIKCCEKRQTFEKLTAEHSKISESFCASDTTSMQQFERKTKEWKKRFVNKRHMTEMHIKEINSLKRHVAKALQNRSHVEEIFVRALDHEKRFSESLSPSSSAGEEIKTVGALNFPKIREKSVPKTAAKSKSNHVVFQGDPAFEWKKCENILRQFFLHRKGVEEEEDPGFFLTSGKG